ncbi:MAG: large subunit ribosomal protein L22 [Candidatus Berkelbacteria bacterium Licking1014_85]|uniref:50S ribosomal protein L22 n=1 Tax=Candidatus Berkelbacteria bacterium Licking1014_85 TaxID=2017148 RepID=A0A554LM44_9BACT|nr:MAG: large subunit ribosomal protein L22 [Candidatus Berkelbacteria bacterium Licking1014_85]
MSQKSFTFRFIRLTPRKLNLGASLIRRKTLDTAYNQLHLTNNKSVLVLKNLLKSAETACVASNMKKDNLFIDKISANEGPKLKRMIPRSHGRTSPFKRRMSHLNLVISDEITRNPKSQLPNSKQIQNIKNK